MKSILKQHLNAKTVIFITKCAGFLKFRRRHAVGKVIGENEMKGGIHFDDDTLVTLKPYYEKQ